MGSNMDDTTGDTNEAAGMAAEKRDLERKGELDEAAAAVRERQEDEMDRLEEAVEKAKDKLDEQR